MGSYPDPNYRVTLHSPYSTVVITNACTIEKLAPLYLFKIKAIMVWIESKLLVGLIGLFLRFSRKLRKEFFKSGSATAFQSLPKPPSSVLPSLYSRNASSSSMSRNACDLGVARSLFHSRSSSSSGEGIVLRVDITNPALYDIFTVCNSGSRCLITGWCNRSARRHKIISWIGDSTVHSFLLPINEFFCSNISIIRGLQGFDNLGYQIRIDYDFAYAICLDYS